MWTARDPEHVCDYEITFTCGKKQLGQIVDRTINKHGFTVAAEVLDAIKATGYQILHHRPPSPSPSRI